MTKSSGFRYFLCLMAVLAVIAATLAVATGDILGSIVAVLQLAISPAMLIIALLAAIPYYFVFVRKEQGAIAAFPKMGRRVMRAPTSSGDLVNYTLRLDRDGTVIAVPGVLFEITTPEHQAETILGLKREGYRFKHPAFIPTEED